MKNICNGYSPPPRKRQRVPRVLLLIPQPSFWHKLLHLEKFQLEYIFSQTLWDGQQALTHITSAGTTDIEGNPGNPPEDTGATDGVDIVDHTSPIEGTITCACSSDTTAVLSCDAALEHVANHEMAPAGGTTPIEMVPAIPTQKCDNDYHCAHTSPNYPAP